MVVNARHIKYVPGHKTDEQDSDWICKLLRSGLLKGSFVPPKEIRDLQDLVRYRRKLEYQITSEKNRTIKILEEDNIKLSSVMKVSGVSGERILSALLNGETDVDKLAGLCHGRVKADRGKIKRCLTGALRDHHKFMLEVIRANIAQTELLISKLDSEIDNQLSPYAHEVALLSGIPGVGVKSAGELISEIGVDMSVFPSDKHLSSWTGVCLGNNESAGKKSGRTTHGNKQVKYFKTKIPVN